jgi:hypothetical protein
MRLRPGLHPDQTRRQRSEDLGKLGALKLFTDEDLAAAAYPVVVVPWVAKQVLAL